MVNHSTVTQHPLVNAVTCWVTRLVVGEGLCPWAAPVVRDGTLRFIGTDAPDLEALLHAVRAELERLINTAPAILSTTILVHTGDLLADFDDYLDALHLVEAALTDAGLDGELQVASFHPNYRFAGPADDAAHYTNRSPAPLFHFIREADVSAAIASHPDIDAVPRRNIEHMRTLGRAHLEALLADCKGPQ
jgi:hypothetical protein